MEITVVILTLLSVLSLNTAKPIRTFKDGVPNDGLSTRPYPARPNRFRNLNDTVPSRSFSGEVPARHNPAKHNTARHNPARHSPARHNRFRTFNDEMPARSSHKRPLHDGVPARPSNDGYPTTYNPARPSNDEDPTRFSFSRHYKDRVPATHFGDMMPASEEICFSREKCVDDIQCKNKEKDVSGVVCHHYCCIYLI